MAPCLAYTVVGPQIDLLLFDPALKTFSSAAD